MKKEKKRTYHGWIIVEDGGQGFKDYIWAEWQDEKGNRQKYGGYTDNPDKDWRGESGCARAVEWWDKKIGKPIKLQPMLKGSYRVYTEE